MASNGAASGGSGTLAKQYVEFVTAGLVELEEALDVLRGNLGIVDDAGKALGDHINSEFSEMANQLTSNKAKVIALEAALTSGGYGRFAADLAKTNMQLETLRKQTALADLSAQADTLAAALSNPEHTSALNAIASGMASVQQRMNELKFPERVAESIAAMGAASEATRVRMEAMRQTVATGEFDRMANEAARAAAEMRGMTFNQRVGQGVDEFAAKLDAARVRLAVLRTMSESTQKATQQAALPSPTLATPIDSPEIPANIEPPKLPPIVTGNGSENHLAAVKAAFDSLPAKVQQMMQAGGVSIAANAGVRNVGDMLAAGSYNKAAKSVQVFEGGSKNAGYVLRHEVGHAVDDMVGGQKPFSFSDQYREALAKDQSGLSEADRKKYSYFVDPKRAERETFAENFAHLSGGTRFNAEGHEKAFANTLALMRNSLGSSGLLPQAMQTTTAPPVPTFQNQMPTVGDTTAASPVDAHIPTAQFAPPVPTAQLAPPLPPPPSMPTATLAPPEPPEMPTAKIAPSIDLTQMKAYVAEMASIDLTQMEAYVAEMAKINAEMRELERPIKIGLELESMLDQTEQARVKLEALKQAVASGDYATNAKEMAKITEEMERVKKAADWDILKKQQGTIGAWASYFKGQIGSVAQTVSSTLSGAMNRATQAVQGNIVSPAAIGAAVAGFSLVTQAAQGWVNAGLAGTSHGNALSMHFTLLSQQIAGVFVPTINMAIAAIETIGNWFRNLTGEQQGNIRRWIEAAAVMLAATQIIGRLQGMFGSLATTIVGGMVSAAGAILSTLVPAFGTLVTAVASGSGIMAASLGFATAGITTILGIAAAAASALVSLGVAGSVVGVGLAVGTQTGRNALQELVAGFAPVVNAVTGLGRSLWAIIGPVAEAIGGRVGALIGEFGQVLGRLFARAQPLIERLGRLFADLGDSIGGALDRIDLGPLEALGELAIEVGGWLLDAFVEALPAMRRIWTVLSDGIGTLMEIGQAIVEAVLRFTDFEAILTIIGTGIAIVGALIGSVMAALALSFAPAIAAGLAIIAVLSAIGYAVYRVLVAFGLLGNSGSFFESLQEGIRGLATMLEGLANFLRVTMPNAVREMINEVYEGLRRLGMAMGVAGGPMLALATELRHALNNWPVQVAADIAGGGGQDWGNGVSRRRPTAQSGNQPQTAVNQAGGQFEQAQDLFRRINEAAIKTDIQRSNELLEIIARNTAPQAAAPAAPQQVQLPGQVAPPG